MIILPRLINVASHLINKCGAECDSDCGFLCLFWRTERGKVIFRLFYGNLCVFNGSPSPTLIVSSCFGLCPATWCPAMCACAVHTVGFLCPFAGALASLRVFWASDQVLLRIWACKHKHPFSPVSLSLPLSCDH